MSRVTCQVSRVTCYLTTTLCCNESLDGFGDAGAGGLVVDQVQNIFIGVKTTFWVEGLMHHS